MNASICSHKYFRNYPSIIVGSVHFIYNLNQNRWLIYKIILWCNRKPDVQLIGNDGNIHRHTPRKKTLTTVSEMKTHFVDAVMNIHYPLLLPRQCELKIDEESGRLSEWTIERHDDVDKWTGEQEYIPTKPKCDWGNSSIFPKNEKFQNRINFQLYL